MLHNTAVTDKLCRLIFIYCSKINNEISMEGGSVLSFGLERIFVGSDNLFESLLLNHM